MCIIIVKRSGVKIPTKKVLRSCFDSNPDGAGIMFQDGDSVRIEKGFMGFKPFWKFHQTLDLDPSIPIVYHFRIATAGGTSPANTHPFPVSDSDSELTALRVKGLDLAICHNGILPIKSPPRMSDTQIFIKTVLSGVKGALLEKTPAILNLIELSTFGSRLAFLFADGDIITMGQGWIQDSNGLSFSNDSYLPRTAWYSDNFSFGKDSPSSEFCAVCGGILDVWGQDCYCAQCDTVNHLSRSKL